nr:HAMP domain-containing histidine kinase [Acholeplasmatales bacterium]
CEYVIIDNDENVIYSYGNNLSDTLNKAYKNGDTIIDIEIDGNVVGKIIVKNTDNNTLDKYQNNCIVMITTITIIQLICLVIYFIYLYYSVFKPFKKMREFAERISTGNLDIPLNMDKGRNFGVFTESFDIMRYELKKAKLAEMEAEKSKRELVARLSHDIKTPVASIKALSELGAEISEDNVQNKFISINQKADQINTLINNLFTVTIEELDKLSVNPSEMPSYVIKELIINSDYLNKTNTFRIPECNVYFDRLRLQQVFDNIIMNSYKYANTKIEIESKIVNDNLLISIKDYGDTILDKDIPLLFEKYTRGSNVINKDGAGLGLYITKKFIEEMNGDIEIVNDKPGFRVNLFLRII